MIHAGRVNRTGPEFLERRPVVKGNVGVKQRNFLCRGQRFFLLVGKLFADVRDHDVPACQDRVLRLGRIYLAAAGIADFHFFRAGGVAEMLHANGRAVQANAHGRPGVIELCVIRFGQNNIGGRVPWNGVGNQLTDQQARDTGIAVGKVEEVFLGFFIRNGIAVHALARRMDPASFHRGREDRIPTRLALKPRRCRRPKSPCGSAWYSLTMSS